MVRSEFGSSQQSPEELAKQYPDLFLAKANYGALIQQPGLFRALGYSRRQAEFARNTLSILAETGTLRPLSDNPYLDFTGRTKEGKRRPENATITRVSRQHPHATALIGDYHEFPEPSDLTGQEYLMRLAQTGHIFEQPIFGPMNTEVARIALFQPHAKLDDVDFLVQTLIGFTEDAPLIPHSRFSHLTASITHATTYEAAWIDDKHTLLATNLHIHGTPIPEQWIFKRLQRLPDSHDALIPFGRMAQNNQRTYDWIFTASGTPVTVPTHALPNPI